MSKKSNVEICIGENCIGADDLVFIDKEGICSGGFCVNSIMMKSNISPIKTININHRNEFEMEKVSDLFNDLAVPNWSYSNWNPNKPGNKEEVYEDEGDSDIDDIEDDLYNKLLELVKHDTTKTKMKKIKRTKRKRETLGGGKKTKKNTGGWSLF